MSSYTCRTPIWLHWRMQSCSRLLSEINWQNLDRYIEFATAITSIMKTQYGDGWFACISACSSAIIATCCGVWCIDWISGDWFSVASFLSTSAGCALTSTWFLKMMRYWSFIVGKMERLIWCKQWTRNHTKLMGSDALFKVKFWSTSGNNNEALQESSFFFEIRQNYCSVLWFMLMHYCFYKY